jgi:hypothetical protein
MFFTFRFCGYARFIHCKASYDTPRRGIDHSFIVSYMTVMSNVKYPREISHKQAVTIKNGYALKGAFGERMLDYRGRVVEIIP